jgi:hypothetical protein
MLQSLCVQLWSYRSHFGIHRFYAIILYAIEVQLAGNKRIRLQVNYYDYALKSTLLGFGLPIILSTTGKRAHSITYLTLSYGTTFQTAPNRAWRLLRLARQ